LAEAVQTRFASGIQEKRSVSRPTVHEQANESGFSLSDQKLLVTRVISETDNLEEVTTLVAQHAAVDVPFRVLQFAGPH